MLQNRFHWQTSWNALGVSAKGRVLLLPRLLADLITRPLHLALILPNLLQHMVQSPVLLTSRQQSLHLRPEALLPVGLLLLGLPGGTDLHGLAVRVHLESLTTAQDMRTVVQLVLVEGTVKVQVGSDRLFPLFACGMLVDSPNVVVFAQRHAAVVLHVEAGALAEALVDCLYASVVIE